MSVLGEAFIAVKADMSPFRRELSLGTKAAAEEFEKNLSGAVEKGVKDGAAKGADQAADEVTEKIRKRTKDRLGDKNHSPWLDLAGALGGALDDGISALPTELKAAIVAGILASLPIIGGGLTGAISAAVVAGVAILGVALVSQFEIVQTRWGTFVSTIRKSLVDAASPFVEVTLGAIDTIDDQIAQWAPLFEDIFEKASRFVMPILQGVLDGLEFIFESIDRGLDNGGVFAQALADSIAILADAIGEVIEILMSTGDAGADALRDLVFVVGLLLVGAAELLKIFTGFYTMVKQIAQAVPDLLAATQPYILLIKAVTNASENAKVATDAYAYTNVQYVEGIGQVITMTEDEEKALKELEKAIEDARDAAFDAIQVNIDWERSIDQLDESFKKNGNTISAETEKGRDNLERLGKAIRAAQEEAENRYRMGELSAQQARDLYRSEVEEIYKVAGAYGVTREQIDKVFGKVINLLNLPSPDTEWARALANALERAAAASQRIKYTGAYGDFDPYGRPLADGGIVYQPTQALIGEAGIEAVIPLTRPARAAQLMRQTGLDKMVGGGGDTTVYVYLGNEAFDQHVQKVIVQDNRSQARQLTYGVRP